jgi:hypothetical protein
VKKYLNTLNGVGVDSVESMPSHNPATDEVRVAAPSSDVD